VSDKEFREDLFYRLNVVRIKMPPLRERHSDIRLLVNYFLRKFAKQNGHQPKSIATDALQRLERYRWPGNVRELENVIERALVVSKGDAILTNDLPAELTAEGVLSGPTEAAGGGTSIESDSGGAVVTDIPTVARQLFRWARENSELKVIPAVERELIVAAMQETGGNQVQAAKILGITRATLRKRLEKFGIRQELSIE